MKRLLALLCALLPIAAVAADLLEPEKAFRFSARVIDAGAIEVHFAIADGYYLYRERFNFASSAYARSASSVESAIAAKPSPCRSRNWR